MMLIYVCSRMQMWQIRHWHHTVNSWYHTCNDNIILSICRLKPPVPRAKSVSVYSSHNPVILINSRKALSKFKGRVYFHFVHRKIGSTSQCDTEVTFLPPFQNSLLTSMGEAKPGTSHINNKVSVHITSTRNHFDDNGKEKVSYLFSSFCWTETRHLSFQSPSSNSQY